MAKGPKQMRVAIIGAGMGGLTCALALSKQGFEHISVYETAADLGFVGAGIQLAPNMARILDRLGCWNEVEKEAVDLEATSIRQGSTEEVLAHVDLQYIRQTYGYPHMVGHRSSLAGGLYRACLAEPTITFHFSTSCSDVSFDYPPSFTATTRGKESLHVSADVILAADGVKSATRDKMLSLLKADAKVVDTGQAAYRIMLPRDALEPYPDLLALLDSNAATRWIGEKRHIIAYPVSNKQIYNISSVQPDDNFAAAPSATYTTRGSKAVMLNVFSDFSPTIRRMLSLVPEGEVCEWKLRVHAPLPAWTYGCVALVGDACHPTLPHLAQGAAQAIEDAAVLGVVLSKCPDTSEKSIEQSLRIYQHLRKDRAETLVELAAANGRGLHLGEGEAKEERDRQFRESKENGGKLPDKWADAEVQQMVYGHDCMKLADEQFDQLFAGL